jgi:hypothetical protein
MVMQGQGLSGAGLANIEKNKIHSAIILVWQANGLLKTTKFHAL